MSACSTQMVLWPPMGTVQCWVIKLTTVHLIHSQGYYWPLTTGLLYIRRHFPSQSWQIHNSSLWLNTHTTESVTMTKWEILGRKVNHNGCELGMIGEESRLQQCWIVSDWEGKHNEWAAMIKCQCWLQDAVLSAVTGIYVYMFTAVSH
jgi:hypothetical protein